MPAFFAGDLLLVPICDVVLKLRNYSQEFAVIGGDARILALLAGHHLVLFQLESRPVAPCRRMLLILNGGRKLAGGIYRRDGPESRSSIAVRIKYRFEKGNALGINPLPRSYLTWIQSGGRLNGC